MVTMVADCISDELARQCRAAGAEADPAAGASQRDRLALMLAPASAAALHAGLSPPYRGFIELTGDGIGDAADLCVATVRRGGVAASLTTREAYALDLVGLFAAALGPHFPNLSDEAQRLVRIGLAEAVGNAVIHGNLGIGGGVRATRQGFGRFPRLIKERLAEPGRAGRRVVVLAWPSEDGTLAVSVSYQGDGFDVGDELAKPVALSARCGRGLAIMRKVAQSVCEADGGRMVNMVFRT